MCKLCGAPITAQTCELDHIVPVRQAYQGQALELQALCFECHKVKTSMEGNHSTTLESRFCRYVYQNYAASPRLPPLVCQLQKWDAERPCKGIDVCRCRKNGLANARFPIPVFCPLDCIVPAREGELADLTYVDLPFDGRRGLLDRLPYVGRGWYSKPACAEMLDSGLAQWRHFRWSLEATAHVDQRWLEQALQTMEEAWPEGEEHMAKLSINALVGLFARKPAWRRVEDPLTHCLGGESLLLTGYPGTGKTHLARKIVEALRELGDTVHIITKTHAAVQNVGLGAQTADHWVRRNVRSGRCSATWLVIEELTQLDTPLWADIACLSMNTSMRFLLLGDFRQLPAVLDSFAGAEVCRELKDSQLLHDLAGGWCHELSERWRFDEGVFSFLQWLRVDEAEQVPLREAVQMARQRFPRRGEPEVCLVISHAKRLQINERENRRRAPEDALLVQYAGPETAGTNAPQIMRVWPGLRLVGAGGKVQKGVFVTVSEVGERVALESGQSFEPRELLKHTRLCSAITYASVQGLTLRGRVWLCDVDSPHFTMKHLYMGCSRATSSELLSVL